MHRPSEQVIQQTFSSYSPNMRVFGQFVQRSGFGAWSIWNNSGARRPARTPSITDGTTNTLAVVEAAGDGQGVMTFKDWGIRPPAPAAKPEIAYGRHGYPRASPSSVQLQYPNNSWGRAACTGTTIVPGRPNTPVTRGWFTQDWRASVLPTAAATAHSCSATAWNIYASTLGAYRP